MNAAPLTLRLLDFMDAPDGWGIPQGQEVHGRLLKAVEAAPAAQVIRISLAGTRTDASFSRESVVELARRYRPRRGFCLLDVTDEDLLANWEAGATRREQPLICWVGQEEYRLLGPRPSPGNTQIFQVVMEAEGIGASAAAEALGISLTNASTKLKQLLDQGFVLRSEEVSPSGGKEFVYFRIR